MTAREEMDLLLRVTSQVAQKMLESGGWMHFGTVLGPKRDVQVLMPKSTKENASGKELASYWKREIGIAAEKAKWRAIACCTFATDLRPENSSGENGFVVHIEHFDQGAGAEDAAYKYQGSRGTKITLSETTRASAKRWLMESARPNNTERGI